MTEREWDQWLRVEADARASALATLAVLEAAPLELGRAVAWVECRFGRTDGFSLVHRVGEPFGDAPHTMCGERVPAAIRLVAPLTPNLIRSLGRCRYCESTYAKTRAVAA